MARWGAVCILGDMEKAMKVPGVRKVKGGAYKIRIKKTLPGGEVIDRVKTLPKGTTLSEAVAAREKFLAEIEAGGRRWPTVKAYGEWWIGMKSHLAPGTITRNQNSLNRLLYPYLGDADPETVTRASVLGLVRWMERQKSRLGRPYAPSTLAANWATVAELLKDMSADLGILDPTLRVKPPTSPRKHKPKGVALTRDQLVSLLDYLQTNYPIWYPMICTMSLTGCRVGESQGLCWDQVDFGSEEISLVRHWTREGLVRGTKSGEGRTVPLHPRLRKALQVHRRWLLSQGLPAMGLSFCFPGWSTGKPLNARQATVRLKRACSTLSLPAITSHDLRRTFNTLMIRAGVDRLLIREMVGHTDEAMTELYHRASSSDLKGALGVLDV